VAFGGGRSADGLQPVAEGGADAAADGAGRRWLLGRGQSADAHGAGELFGGDERVGGGEEGRTELEPGDGLVGVGG
jgi:hypothetical protein